MIAKFIPILLYIGIGLLFVVLSSISAVYLDMALVSGQPLDFLDDSLNSIKEYPGLIILFFINLLWLIISPLFFLATKHTKMTGRPFLKAVKIITLVSLGTFVIYFGKSQLNNVISGNDINYLGVAITGVAIGVFFLGINSKSRAEENKNNQSLD